MSRSSESERVVNPDEHLCRVADVVRLLALGRSTVYQLMDAGKLQYVKIGRSRRVPLSAVRALIAANSVG